MSRYLKIFFGYTDATYVNGSFIEEEVKNEAVTCGKDGFVISDDRNKELRLDLALCPDRS